MKRRYTIILLVVALICTAVTAQTDEDTSRKYDAFFLEAINQRVKGNNDAAFDLLRHCVDIDSTKSEAWYFLAQYYDALKENDKAQRCVEKAASLDPDISTYQEILANLYLSKQDYPKAIEVLNRIYEANHDREDVLGALVSIYEDQQDYKSAIQTLNRLEVMEGRSTQFSLKKSGYYTQLGNKKAAIREMQKLANQYPNDLNYRGLYAQALINNGQEEKGLEEIKKFLQTNQKVWNAWFLLGWGMRRLCRWEQAQQAFLQALSCGGDKNADTYNELAICLMELGNLDEAKKTLLKAFAISPEDTKIISNLGYLAEKQGNKEEAQKYFTAVLEFDPNDIIAASELAKLESSN